MKKILSIILVAVLLLSVLPFTAFAGGDETELFLDTPYNAWLGENTEMFKFTPSDDGWYNFYTEGKSDTYATLYNSQFDEIIYVDDTFDSQNFNFKFKLYAGYTYYLEVGAYVEESQTAKFDLIVTETLGVESLYISKKPDNNECIIGLEGDTIDLTGLEVTLTLSDGEEVLWKYDVDGEVAGEAVLVYVDNDGFGHYFIRVECGEGYDTSFFDMVENPVDSISVYRMPAIELYEGTSGYLIDDTYYYNYVIPQETEIQINYTDGTSEIVSYSEMIERGPSSVSDDQSYDNQWGVGEHFATLTYMGREAKVSVKILPCPYESVTLLSAPSYEYYFGDINNGYMQGDKFVLQPYQFDGLSFELGFSDGTSEIITADDIDIMHREIKGYPFEIREIPVTNPGDVEVVISYKGMDIKYSVAVLESPVESLEVLKAPLKSEYEDRYHADYTGLEVLVNYKNGTSEVVTFDETNMKYILSGSLYCGVDMPQSTLRVARDYDEVEQSYYTTVYYLGKYIKYYGIVYNESRTVEELSKVENFSPDTDGMSVTVEYKNGDVETLTYSPADYYDYGHGMLEGFSLTENGVAYFDTALQSENDEKEVYYLYTLQTSVTVELEKFKLGDVNLDGDITIMDATVIQRHVAKITELTGNKLKAADVNKDGDVSIVDATTIQRFVAKIITEF